MTGLGKRQYLAVFACCVVHVGCAGMPAIREFYDSIELGKAFPERPNYPEGAAVTRSQSVEEVSFSKKWHIGRHTEHAVLVIDDNGTVVAKRYARDRGEVFLVFWQSSQSLTEWHICTKQAKTLDEIEAACTRLNSAGTTTAFPQFMNASKEVIREIRNCGGCENERFRFDHVKKSRLFPLAEQYVWRAQRVGADVFRLTIEDRGDACPLIATPAAWIAFPFQKL